MVISSPLTLESIAASPWKNGGGSTRTLAVEPADASLEDFLWRISLAEVSTAGAFSRFAGIDRTILLWSGDGLTLHSPAWSHALDRPYEPFKFRGEEDIHCTLTGGPTIDLNMMVRRGWFEAKIEVVRKAVTLAEAVKTMIVLCAAGQLEIHSAGQTLASLKKNTFLRIDNCDAGMSLNPCGPGSTFVMISLAGTQM
jgi:uncharacterized protein